MSKSRQTAGPRRPPAGSGRAGPAPDAGHGKAGRSAGNYESGGQIVAGATAGLAVGLVTGLTYALLQRPDCGYAGGLVCW